MTAARLTVLALALLLAPAARADQFMFLDLKTAEAALRILHRGDVVHLYCAPCGDAISQRMTVRTLGVDRIWDRPGSARVYTSDGQRFWTVEVNDRMLDLAYVYVRQGAQWHNLAMLAGATPTDVPAQLPKTAVGRRWTCGEAVDDNPYDSRLGERRDPCPIDGSSPATQAGRR